MRTVAPLLTLSLCLLGCGRSDVPREKYFGGEPVEHWLEAVRSPDPKARKRAADVLGNVGPVDPRAVPALIEAVRDKDSTVRTHAATALGRVRGAK